MRPPSQDRGSFRALTSVGSVPPVGLLLGCLIAVASLYGLRLATTGRVWNVPTDFLLGSFENRALGFNMIALHYCIGLAVGTIGVYLLVQARKARCGRLLNAAAGVAILALSLLCFSGMRSVLSDQATFDIVKRSRPLIAALEEYKKDHPVYPQSLTDLLPAYLPEIPDTGYGRRRQFHYYRAEAADSRSYSPQARQGQVWVGSGPYALVVWQVPRRTMVYRPTLKYEDLYLGRRIPGTDWGVTAAD